MLTPANLVVLARSPVVGFDGTPSEHLHGPFWRVGLRRWHHPMVVGARRGLGSQSLANKTVQRMTANLFERAGLAASSPGDTFGAP
ncbi:MAG: hypothetical protein E6J85_16130 [Deltaproteobacteria bacterium]|nr:MAG: hypothetical protein E6J85_16130 [Deltaproteobacteria bacterium]